MKALFTLLMAAFVLFSQAQEKLNVFHVVDTDTRLVIPSVSVVIIRARLAINTEDDGIFSIPGNLGSMRDTIIFSAQNYTTFKIPLRKLSGMDTIALKRFPFKPLAFQPKISKDTLLNDFNRNDVAYYAGIHSQTAIFEYLQLAQQFDLPKADVLLKNVLIYRLAFYLNAVTLDQWNHAGIEYAKFRVRIYGLDKLTGGPGADLCGQIIEMKNKGGKQIKINLEDYKITIPDKVFFVAVEWVRDFYNMGYATFFDEKTLKFAKHVNYRPAIGISPVKTGKLNMWGMNFNHDWKPFTYFSPDFTDLAIKATVQQD